MQRRGQRPVLSAPTRTLLAANEASPATEHVHGPGRRWPQQQSPVPGRPSRTRLAVDALPATAVPLPSIVLDQVPQPPCDRGEGRAARRVCVIGAIGAGSCPPDRTAAWHRFPEVFVVGEPGQPVPGALVGVVRQPKISVRASLTRRTVPCTLLALIFFAFGRLPHVWQELRKTYGRVPCDKSSGQHLGCGPEGQRACGEQQQNGTPIYQFGQTPVTVDGDKGPSCTLKLGSPEITTQPGDAYGEAPENGDYVSVPVTGARDQGRGCI